MAAGLPTGWRVVFAGTPEFAVPSLRALIDAGMTPVAVYTQPDRPAGRGRALTASPVKHCAHAAGIAVHQPLSLRDPAALDALSALRPDLLVVVAYGQILNRGVLDLPTHGCINVHASLLPRWRGAAPIQRAILAGDRESGVSIMRMEAGLDSGPVYLQRSTPIDDADTGGTLHDRLATLGASALLDSVPMIASGVEPQPQDEALVTWAPKLAKDEAWMDWRAPAIELERQVRAFDPWPVTQTRLDEQVIRVFAAVAEPAEHDAAPGTVLEAGRTGVLVAAGTGALRLQAVQRQGGRRISAADFANQRPLSGNRFG